jgi:SAM-dependent methyltransferase
VQGFGYFDDKTNANVLRQMAERLRPRGRLVLDFYHRGFFEGKDGERVLESWCAAGDRDGRTSSATA